MPAGAPTPRKFIPPGAIAGYTALEELDFDGRGEKPHGLCIIGPCNSDTSANHARSSPQFFLIASHIALGLAIITNNYYCMKACRRLRSEHRDGSKSNIEVSIMCSIQARGSSSKVSLQSVNYRRKGAFGRSASGLNIRQIRWFRRAVVPKGRRRLG